MLKEQNKQKNSLKERKKSCSVLKQLSYVYSVYNIKKILISGISNSSLDFVRTAICEETVHSSVSVLPRAGQC